MKMEEENTFGSSPFDQLPDDCKGSYEYQDHNYSRNGYEKRNKELLLLSLARD